MRMRRPRMLIVMLISITANANVQEHEVEFACYPNCDAAEMSTQQNEVEWRGIGAVNVATLKELDGGGSNFGMDTVRYIHNRFGRGIPRCVEMCAGAGLIGFSLYALGVCETIVFIDVNPLAIRAIETTLYHNPELKNKVVVYQSNILKDIPDHEIGTWDIVFANPPHYHQNNKRLIENGELGRAVDKDWLFHQKFYSSINIYLKTDIGHVVFVESRLGSSIHDFFPFLTKDSGLYLAALHDSGVRTNLSKCGSSSREIWYMHSTNSLNWYEHASDVMNPCLIQLECQNVVNEKYVFELSIQQPNDDLNPTCISPFYQDGIIMSEFYA